MLKIDEKNALLDETIMQDIAESLRGKRLLVLGGSDWNNDIRNFCTQNRITIIVAGNDPASKLCDIADEYYNVDSTNEDAIKNLIKVKVIDGVFSCASEVVVPHSIKCTTDLGMYSYASIQQWEALMNKKCMKDNCSKYGIDVIDEFQIDDIDKGIIVFPVIIKPADSSGSRGISVCYSNEQLEEAINKAKGTSKTNDFLIERYIVAPFWQMEIYIKNGIPYFGYSKERVFYPSLDGKAKQPFLDIYPSRYDERIRKDVFPKFSQMVIDLGVKNASVWVQGFITKSHTYVFDVGFRLGGGMENRMMSREKGIDNIKSHITYALCGEWLGDFSKCQYPFETQYVTVCVGLKNGIISKIEGIEEIKKLPYVYDIIQCYREGDEVTKSGLYKQSLLRIFVRAFHDEPTELIKSIYSIINVKSVDGQNMLLPVDKLEWDNQLPL